MIKDAENIDSIDASSSFFNSFDDTRLTDYEYRQLSFEIRFTVISDDGTTILKESIDTCCPLDIYDANYDDGFNISYSEIKFMLTNDDGLLIGENIFNALKFKKNQGSDVTLKAEVIDKYTGDVIVSEEMDQSSFMKAGLEASALSKVIDSVKIITTSAILLSSAYFLIDTNAFDTTLMNNIGDMWDNTAGALGYYMSESVDSFIKSNSSNASSTDLLQSSISSVTDYLKDIAIDSPVKGIGVAIGVKVSDSIKDIYKSFNELGDKKEKVNELYGVDSGEQKEDSGYNPSFTI